MNILPPACIDDAVVPALAPWKAPRALDLESLESAGAWRAFCAEVMWADHARKRTETEESDTAKTKVG